MNDGKDPQARPVTQTPDRAGIATKHRRGTLYRRGRVWWLKFMIGGRYVYQSLNTESREKANEERDRILRPVRLASTRESLAVIARRLADDEAAAEKAEHPPAKIGEAFDLFLASPSRPDSGKNTLRQYEAEYRRFASWIGREWPGLVYMRDIAERTAEAYAQDLTKAGASASTFNQHVGFLALLWRILQKHIRAQVNPWAGIKRKRLTGTHGRRELTVDELRRVCAAAEGERRLLFALGIYTGMRLGDCATLRWGEVDMARGILRRIPMKTARRNPRPTTIPIHPVLRTMLLETPAERRRGFVLPKTATEYQGDNSTLCKEIGQHFEACGIEIHKAGTGIATQEKDEHGKRLPGTGKRAVVEVGFHSLRHSFVSMCREAGAPLAVVEAIVGHSSPAMTRHYTHVSELAAGAAVASLPAVVKKDGEDYAEQRTAADAIRAGLDSLKVMTERNWKAKRSAGMKHLSEALEIVKRRDGA